MISFGFASSTSSLHGGGHSTSEPRLRIAYAATAPPAVNATCRRRAALACERSRSARCRLSASSARAVMVGKAAPGKARARMTPDLDRDGLAGRIAGLPGFEACVRPRGVPTPTWSGRGARRPARARAGRPRPGRRRRPPGARPGARRRAPRARPVRHRDGHRRRTHRGRRPRSRRVLSVSGRAARGPAGRDRRGPLAPRLQRQRDGGRAERPRRADRPSGRPGGPARAASCTSARSPTTRRARCARPLRPDWASSPSRERSIRSARPT